MIGGNVTERQWQEVEAIVRKYQRNMAGNRYYENDYAELSNILDELYLLAHPPKEQLADAWSFE